MKIFVSGHKGYMGSVLVPMLERKGHKVSGLDWNGGEDIRDPSAVSSALEGCDVVIHLANISNDPSFDLSPGLAKSVNWDCFPMMVEAAHRAGVKRFIFASSSSVYGVKKEKNVTEDLILDPLTEYSKYKVMCEEYLIKHCPQGMEFVIVRPATICGYSPSMRLDLLVNIFAHHGWKNKKIRVHGGYQYRPNIHIKDMAEAYIKLLDAPGIDGEIFNCGYKNLTLLETAELVKNILGDVEIEIEESKDPRSYHVNSDKIRYMLGFECKYTIEDAIKEMVMEFPKMGDLEDAKYYRVRQLKNAGY